MLDDVINSTKQSLVERLASPLAGSFVVAWCLWNWKFLVILFSATTVSQTFDLVERLAFPDWTAIVMRGLILPLLTAVGYIFIYPYPARFIYEFNLHRQREIAQTKQRIADETPLTLEESRRIRADYVDRERKNKEVVEELNEQIARLNAALDAAKEAPETPAELSSAERLYDKLEPSQFFLLHILEKAGSPALEKELIEKSPEPTVKTEFDIGELERRKLLHRNYDASRRGYTLEFTHAGRRALLDSKKSEPGTSESN